MKSLSQLEEKAVLEFGWAPEWMVGVGVLIGSAIIALVLYYWILRTFVRLASRFGTFPQLLVDRARGPSAAILVMAVLGATLPAAGLSNVMTTSLAHLLLIGFVLSVGWGAFNALDAAAVLYLRRFQMDVPDNLLARKHLTQVNILKRAAQILGVIVAVSGALMTIAAVRQYGVSLFASAGAAGLVVGLSARPLLSNLIAGIQLALTQPIRIEDAVVVEGEWGWIEIITSTYVVIRIWDLRRLIVPLTYFIEKPFQNWTHQSADLLGSVMLNVDFTVPVDRVREKLQEIVKQSPLWDGKVAVVQVTDTPQNMVQLRALVSAGNSGQAWDLRCEVREKLIAFLQTEYPHALPRQRAEIIGNPNEDYADQAFHGPHVAHPRKADLRERAEKETASG
jgi:small-conductance mechanosensitive channel